MKKYKRFEFKKEPEKVIIKEEMQKPIVETIIKAESVEQPVKIIETTKPAESIIDADGDNLKGIVLMLNQVLTELNTVNQKLAEASIKPISMPTAEKVVESVEKGVRRKIILTRDESGKITGADVIDSVQE